MADRKISQATERTVLDGTEQVPVAHNGNPFKVLLSTVSAWVVGLFENKLVLDELSDTGSKLYYKGAAVSESSSSSGVVNLVQLSDGAGGFISDATMVFNAATKVFQAGKSFKDDGKNLFAGYEAGAVITSGEYNTLVGFRAGDAITSASDCVAVGRNALGANQTRSDLLGIGRDALLLATGQQNVAIGATAGAAVTTGERNTILGYGAGSARNFSNAVLVGNLAAFAAASDAELNYRLIIEADRNATKDYLVHGDFYDRWIKFGGAVLDRRLDYESRAVIQTGNPTGASPTVVDDASKTWTVNAYVDMVVRVSLGDYEELARIVSNTATRLTLGHTLAVTPSSSWTYDILPTTLVKNEELGSVVAADITDGDYAFLLPDISAAFIGATFKAFIDANPNAKKVYIVGYDDGTIQGHRHVTLENLYEGISLQQHTTTKWMVLNTENSIAAYHGNISSAIAFNEAAHENIGELDATLEKRFTNLSSGIRYDGITPIQATIVGSITVYKAGAADVNVTIGVGGTANRDFEVTGKTSSNNPWISIPICATIYLNYDDVVSIMANTTAAISIEQVNLIITD